MATSARKLETIRVTGFKELIAYEKSLVQLDADELRYVQRVSARIVEGREKRSKLKSRAKIELKTRTKV